MFWVLQILNGLSFGMLLFLLGAGLSLIYGVMRILNLAHGSYYVLGAYVALSVVQVTGSFALAAVAGTAAVIGLGVLMERVFLRRVPREELPQETLPRPEAFARSVRLGSLVFPSYRLFIIGVGVGVGLGLWAFQERTRLGAMVRATVDDAAIAQAIGIDVSRLSTAIFALGAGLAALGGILGGPLLGVYPGVDFEVLLLGFVVVIIGGLGSLTSALVGGLLVGLLDTFGKSLFPQLALFTIFAPMAIILAVRPTGLFGTQ